MGLPPLSRIDGLLAGQLNGKGHRIRVISCAAGRTAPEKFDTVIGGVALPNDASVALHEQFEFEKVAQFREVGNKFDRWIDVGYWQLLL